MLPEVKVETHQYALGELRDLSDKELAESLKPGNLDIVVNGALSEWGSALEDTLRKLESCVMAWREDGKTKSVLIHFVEEAPPQEPETEDIIRLDPQ